MIVAFEIVQTFKLNSCKEKEAGQEDLRNIILAVQIHRHLMAVAEYMWFLCLDQQGKDTSCKYILKSVHSFEDIFVPLLSMVRSPV